MSRRRWAAALAAALLAAAPAWGATAGLVVALDYVVPEFVPGAKVRTPESVDGALAETVADTLGRPLRTVPAAGASAAGGPPGPDAVLTMVQDPSSGRPGTVVIPTGYRAGAMAIMRSDTDIKRWDQLRDRTVCLSEGSPYVGLMASRHHAQERLYPAPADVLLALRIGECDAAVHDDVMLKALLKLPEWKKFSARLPAVSKNALVFLVPDSDPGLASRLRAMVRSWRKHDLLARMNSERVRDIAFEVYLDQVVPDCH